MLDDMEKAARKFLEKFSGGDLLIESIILRHLSENFRKRGLKKEIEGEPKENQNYSLFWREIYKLSIKDEDIISREYLIPSKSKISQAIAEGKEVKGVEGCLRSKAPFLLPKGLLKLVVVKVKKLL